MKEVALVGFASSTNKYAWDLPEDVPIWSLNDAFNKGFPRLDLIFDPHYIEHIKHTAYIKGREDHSRIDWLRSNTEIPIYMLKAYDEVPMARRYPWEDVIEMLGGKDDLTSTFALMMAFAVLQGYERVYVYGFNMGVSYEYRHQLPGGKAMIWFARGRGVEVIGPSEGSQLFRPTKIYGLEGTAMINRRTLDKAQEAYKIQARTNEANFYKWKGILEERKKGFVGKNGTIMGNKDAIGEAAQECHRFDVQRFGSQSIVEALQRLIDEADMIETEPVQVEIRGVNRGVTNGDSERVFDPS